DNDRAGHERCDRRGQKRDNAPDFHGLADAPQGGGGDRSLQTLGVFPQGAGKIGFDQTRRHAVDAHIPRPPLDRQAARELHVGGLRDAVGAKLRAAAQAANRGHGHHAAATLLGHAGNGIVAEPKVALDVRAHDLVEGVVGYFFKRPEVGIDGGVAYQRIDPPPLLERAFDETLDLLLARDIAGDHDRFAAAALDRRRHGFACIRLAAGNYDLGTEPSHDFSCRATDTLARTGDDGYLAGEIEWI